MITKIPFNLKTTISFQTGSAKVAIKIGYTKQLQKLNQTKKQFQKQTAKY